MEDLFNNLDSLEAETNNVQNIVNANYQVRLQMSQQMEAIIQIITYIQAELDKLEKVQDAAKDLAELKGKITQNNEKQKELLAKMQVLKQELEKSPNIEELQTTLNSIKKNLNEDILNHNKFKGNAPPGNSPNQTRGPSLPPTPEQRGVPPPIPDPRGDMLGGYRYSGSSPGKIIRSIKSKTKSKRKKKINRTRTKRRM